MFRADLHCHTTCSDGTLSPEEIVHLAKESGLAGLSITDHDTFAAYETAIPVAKEIGLLLGAGIEFSSEHQGESVHILGYDFLLDDPGIAALCLHHRTRRKERNLAILKKLADHKMFITEEELKGEGRPHIAACMVKKGYVTTIREAFNLYIGDGKKCFAKGDAISSQETIDTLHKAGGKAFIAHPHLLSKPAGILKLNFDGIECRYARFTPDKEKPWLKIAESKKWLASGGSDFHGLMREDLVLGSSWVDEKTFNEIFQKPL